MCIFDEQTNPDLPGEIDGYFDLTAAHEMVDAHREACMSRETGFAERSLDELMKLKLEERWRLMLAEVDEYMDEQENETAK